jgi:hypothetical protein
MTTLHTLDNFKWNETGGTYINYHTETLVLVKVFGLMITPQNSYMQECARQY